ncbi:MAG: MFS transporter [Rhodobacteraceae bacterium]|jgi:MFS family permease|uniref:MFS transporter n=1 Tax=Albidovulum sp. TaxID=1872424 RepID=UPI00265901D4|nr:MFS transporter [uncultured Defluviimonas sp.]MCC0070113.1 MFS transporter [Paracoccaceae bacterium]
MRANLPRGVVALGFVSLFMDISSEMIHGLLPVFLTGTLGASVVLVGLVEGLGEAVAQIVKVFSGALSDRLGRRKPLLVLGYGLAALTKPVFALAGSPGVVLAARVTDRIGKGIRGAPRDALVAELVPEAARGAAYGLRQSMDTVGAFTGPLLAIALMALTGGDIRLVFALAILPAAVALAILVGGVREPARHEVAAPRAGLDGRTVSSLPAAFWSVVAVGAVMAFARLSEAFLILKAADVGVGAAYVPLVLVILNVVYAATAWPAGALSDRLGRGGLLGVSIAALALALGLLAMAEGLSVTVIGIALWGLHMGLSQGLLSAAVADTAPAALRGTAFGVFNLAAGLATLAANGAAGLLWAAGGSAVAFGAAGAAALLAFGLVCVLPSLRG